MGRAVGKGNGTARPVDSGEVGARGQRIMISEAEAARRAGAGNRAAQVRSKLSNRAARMSGDREANVLKNLREHGGLSIVDRHTVRETEDPALLNAVVTTCRKPFDLEQAAGNENIDYDDLVMVADYAAEQAELHRGAGNDTTDLDWDRVNAVAWRNPAMGEAAVAEIMEPEYAGTKEQVYALGNPEAPREESRYVMEAIMTDNWGQYGSHEGITSLCSSDTGDDEAVNSIVSRLKNADRDYPFHDHPRDTMTDRILNGVNNSQHIMDSSDRADGYLDAAVENNRYTELLGAWTKCPLNQGNKLALVDTLSGHMEMDDMDPDEEEMMYRITETGTIRGERNMIHTTAAQHVHRMVAAEKSPELLDRYASSGKCLASVMGNRNTPQDTRNRLLLDPDSPATVLDKASAAAHWHGDSTSLRRLCGRVRRGEFRDGDFSGSEDIVIAGLMGNVNEYGIDGDPQGLSKTDSRWVATQYKKMLDRTGFQWPDED